jgi:hypothetical protein
VNTRSILSQGSDKNPELASVGLHHRTPGAPEESHTVGIFAYQVVAGAYVVRRKGAADLA